MFNKFLVIIGTVILIAASIGWFLSNRNNSISSVDDDLIIENTPDPSLSVSPQTTDSQEYGGKNIIVFSPKPGDKVGSPFTVKGRARVFENTFMVAIRENSEVEIYKEKAMANAPDTGQFGDFEVKIPVPVSAAGKKITLEVFNYSAKDGSVENLVSMPVEITVKETIDVDVFFTNSKLDPENTCVKTFPIKRQILKTQGVAYMSLYQLIQGPNIGELGEGYDTGIPGNAIINSIVISNGTAYVDFDEGLEYGVAGSCRVNSIRSQIEATLKQFPTVKNVVISINGKTEDILQP